MRARSAMIRISAKFRRVDFEKTGILQRTGIDGGMMPPIRTGAPAAPFSFSCAFPRNQSGSILSRLTVPNARGGLSSDPLFTKDWAVEVKSAQTILDVIRVDDVYPLRAGEGHSTGSRQRPADATICLATA
jgi:hypothetical protein